MSAGGAATMAAVTQNAADVASVMFLFTMPPWLLPLAQLEAQQRFQFVGLAKSNHFGDGGSLMFIFGGAGL